MWISQLEARSAERAAARELARQGQPLTVGRIAWGVALGVLLASLISGVVALLLIGLGV